MRHGVGDVWPPRPPALIPLDESPNGVYTVFCIDPYSSSMSCLYGAYMIDSYCLP
jgi:hypothetical protein